LPVAGCQLPDLSPPPRILIVRFSSLGDILLSTPLLRAIRQRHPKAWVSYVTKTAFVPLLAHNPRVSEVIGYDPATPLATLARRLRAARYTHRLDLHGSVRSRLLRLLVPGTWGGYPKHRVARTVLIRTKRDAYRDRRPVAERYFDAAKTLGVVPDEHPLEFFMGRHSIEAGAEFLSARGLSTSRGLVAVAPGAKHPTKQWPLHHWKQLVAEVTARMDVVVLGGPADRALAEEVAAAGGANATSAAGIFDVGGTAALLKTARCAVAGDTGLMHLATAVNTPVVALFGPTVKQFGFTPYRARATVLELGLPCRPCSAIGGARCPLGHHRCLEDIAPSQVLEAIRRLPR